MHAVALHEMGTAPRLTELPVRTPAAGEVLVRVAASSVNGFDVAVADGWIRDFMEYRFPVVLGKDFAGTVEAVGPDVSHFAVGDDVFGVVMTPYVGADGGFAEFVVVGEGYGIARVPEGMDLVSAGALGLAGSAAATALDALALKAGQILLVSGATGGVGAIAVEYAAAAGVRVIGTARPGEESEFVRGLGAERTVDWSSDLEAEVRAAAPDGVDAVLHLADDPSRLVTYLASDGCLVSTLMFGSDQHPAAVAVVADPQERVLDRLAADVVAGRLRVPVTRSYPLAEVPTALADFRKGTVGKFAVAVA
ncbi:MAG TPA: alcohol dehydrogenase catalytic domain-containing protein [Blastococcus sp.]|nr:alcohol dehydrogenase catalytic domain-containing protein [Blastococcus sp.]